MSLSYPTAFAHSILAITSVWAITKANEYHFATLGFILYLLNGVLGILSYGIPQCNRHLYRIYSQMSLWSLTFGLPLFVTQLYINSGFSQSIALAHFLLPLSYIFSSHHFKRFHMYLLDTLQIIYLCFLTYICLQNNFYYGLSTGISYIIGFYAVGTTGTVINVPSKDLFNYALSFSVYFLVRTLHE